VRILGDGFPAGRRGLVTLVGTSHRPGAEPLDVRAEARARALSTTSIELVATEDLLSSLGGRGTFHGTMRVEFAGADGRGTVSGLLEAVSLDFAPASAGDLVTDLSNARAATDLLTDLGVVPVSDDDASLGLRIDALRRDGPGDRAGLRKGDRIVAVDGVSIGSTSDFSPPPSARRATLQIQRPGEIAELRIVVPLHRLAVEQAARSEIPWVATAIGVCLLLIFLAPTAQLTERLVSSIAGVRQERRAVQPPEPTDPGLRARIARLRARLGRATWAAVGTLAVVSALGAFPFTARALTGDLDVAIALLLALAARLGTHIVGVPPREDGRPARRLSRMLPVSAEGVRDGVGAICAVSCIVIASGTLRLEGVVAAQGGSPLAWYVLRSPIAFVAFGVLMASIGGGAAWTRGTVSQIAERTHLFVMSGLATALFLGGWRVPGLPGDPLEASAGWRLLAAAIFIAKAGAVFALASRLARRTSTAGRWAWPAVGLVCAAASAVTLAVPVPPMVERTSGPVLVAAVAGLAAYAVVRWWRSPGGRLHLTPFL